MSEKNTKDSFLKKWATFFVENYRITILLIVMVIFTGVYSLLTVRRDDIPPINVPFYIVNATYPGSSAADIEKQIISPVEKEIKDVEGIKKITSTSQNNFGFIVAEVEADADFETAKTEIKSAAEKVQLPENAEKLTFSEAGFNDQPFMYLGLIGEEDENKLQEHAATLKAELEEIEGVKKATVDNARDTETRITLNLDKIKDKGVTVDQVTQALQGANVALPGGEINRDTGVLPIEVKGEFTSLDDIKNTEIVVQNQANPLAPPQVVKIDEIATVESKLEESENVSVGAYQEEGEFISGDVMLVGVVKSENADLVDTGNAVSDFLENYDTNELGENVKIFTGYTSAEEVEKDINGLRDNAIVGAIIILIVLSFFVSVRGSIVVVLAIPLVMLATFAFFSFIGFSFNVITLFALLITLGLLVDNAIVIVESIQHNLEHGLKRKEAVIKAVSDVGPAIFSATLTTVIVFVPLALLPGITGEFIKYIPYVVITSIVSSYIVAVTITPLIGKKFMKLSKKHQERIKKRGVHGKFIEAFGEHVGRNLKSMPKRIAVLFIAFVLVAASFSLPASGTLESETWPAQDDADFAGVNFDFPTGTKLSQKEDVVKEVLPLLEDIEEIDSVVPLNFSEGPGASTGGASLTMVFDKEKTRTAKEIVAELQDKIEEKEFSVPQGEVIVEAEQFAEGPPQSEFDIIVQVFDEDLDALKKAAGTAVEELKDVEGVEDAANTVEETLVKKVAVSLDREKLKDKNVSGFVAAGTVRSLFTEETAGSRTNDADKTEDIIVAFEDDTKNSLEDVKTTPVTTNTGETVNLEEIATIEEVEDTAAIKHVDNKRFVELNIKIKDDVMPQVMQARIQDEYFTEDKFEELGIKDGSVEFGGAFSEEQEDFGNLGNSLIIAIILVYIILVAQFKSFTQPFIILLTIPLALILVFPGLILTGNPFSFFAGLGIVALVGIVVNDAIVMIDAINRYRKEGMTRDEAIIAGTKQRFKPILATSITTIGGVLPLALVNPFMSALGYALVFGLISATIFTLYVVPLIYGVFVRRKSKV